MNKYIGTTVTFDHLDGHTVIGVLEDVIPFEPHGIMCRIRVSDDSTYHIESERVWPKPSHPMKNIIDLLVTV